MVTFSLSTNHVTPVWQGGVVSEPCLGNSSKSVQSRIWYRALCVQPFSFQRSILTRSAAPCLVVQSVSCPLLHQCVRETEKQQLMHRSAKTSNIKHALLSAGIYLHLRRHANLTACNFAASAATCELHDTIFHMHVHDDQKRHVWAFSCLGCMIVEGMAAYGMHDS